MAKAWFTEKHTPHAGITLALGGRLFDQKSPYQHVEVVETVEYGRMLLLDGCVMVTDRDEFVYHEMITHPALLAHPKPEQVLIIGGGDGGSVREVLRHRAVRAVHLVEIDQVVIDASRQFFPALAKDLDDSRVKVLVKDGFDHLDNHQSAYDVILVDSMDPVGEAAKLFTSPFFAKVKAALKPGGIAVFQSESPFYHTDILRQLLASMKTIFRHVAPYLAAIPTYPSGLWSFTFASDAVNPLTCTLRSEPALADGLKYFHPDLFRAAFVTPNYVRQITPK